MGKKENSRVFIQNMNLKNKMFVLHDKLKRHLSGELLYLTDKKDDLENQVLQLKIEKEQKDKTLFQTIEKRDIRKYFSPLNLTEIEEEKKDERQKQLSMSIKRFYDEISRIDNRIEEIRDFLHEMDELVEDKNFLQYAEEKDSEIKIGLFSDDMNMSFEEELDDESRTEELDVGNVVESIEKDEFSSKEDEYINEPMCSFTQIHKKVYPQLLRNLYDMADYFHEKYENMDVLIEFNDNNIELDVNVNQSLLKQVEYNIQKAVEDYNISMILVQGAVKEESIDISLSYMCEAGMIDTMKITYVIQRK